ncbi:NAD-dependent epimerase/dehydratase family protein [Planosporangium flavigriseum]|uniref:Nucleoside-diphosphate sugar epimerase n=1 Tax=Planosporangium flavigriseum TaxID=373681 RepID=A0A8J3LMM0_9ACTN|nr:NAD-dependent epimerase/dehydratase family protein [Planosporangium flavigriseum]NJC67513.1 NAD-dependent epimerase/dehydratase family protein [Planosporangium flavigriseum]GIG75537.1 nucleoside-diphosphate sugar epimerase [Planosporangium flavigriseum]
MHGGTTLVTGGAGFIGSHLVDALLARGESVIVLDDLSTGRLSNLDNAAANPRLRFVRGSVLDESLVDRVVRDSDTVVHLAAAVGVKLVVEQPLKSLQTNIRGAENIIEAAHRHGSKILVTSTSEIYGKNASGPLREDADRILGSPGVMRWAYSTAKVVDEILANAYHREQGLRSIVVRLFNTVGPRQSPSYGMVIPRLVHQALAGEPLTVYGDGQQTRCFAHVADVVSALVALLDEPAAIGETFNIGNSGEISILELAKRVLELAGSDSGIALMPFEEVYGTGFEDMNRRVPDTGKLRALTGWEPRRGLDETLRDIIAEVRGASGGASNGTKAQAHS